jgi:hypothetical protein
VDLHLENKFDARVEVSCVDPLEGVYKAAHRHYFIHVGITHRKESLCYNYWQVAVLSKSNFVNGLLTL